MFQMIPLQAHLPEIDSWEILLPPVLSGDSHLDHLSVTPIRGPENPDAVAAKSLQSCPTLCDPIDGSPPGSPVPGILQARTREWVAISFSNA